MIFGYAWTFGETLAPAPEKRTPALPRPAACLRNSNWPPHPGESGEGHKRNLPELNVAECCVSTRSDGIHRNHHNLDSMYGTGRTAFAARIRQHSAVTNRVFLSISFSLDFPSGLHQPKRIVPAWSFSPSKAGRLDCTSSTACAVQLPYVEKSRRRNHSVRLTQVPSAMPHFR